MDMSSSQFDQHPQDPQHPPDLLSSHPTNEFSSLPMMQPSPSSPYSMNPSSNWPQSTMSMVPPELDPPVDTSGLDRKTAGNIQQQLAKWVRDRQYNLSPGEGKPLLRPFRNLIFGLIGGTIAGKIAMTRFFPNFTAGPRGKAWMIGLICGGYPLSGAAIYLTQIPAVKEVLEQKSPMGIQARYFYRTMQAEKSGLPPPPPPFGMATPSQQPGMPSNWNSPYGQPPQSPPQMMQWNSFPQEQQQQQQPPQHPPSNTQPWGQSQQGNGTGPQGETRFRSWDDIRQARESTGQNSHPDDSPSHSNEMQ